jgi:hypothetical protein
MRNDISLYCGPSRYPALFTPRVVFTALFLWLFAIVLLTALMAAAGIDWVYARPGGRAAFNQSMLAASTLIAIVVAPTLLVRKVRPQWTLTVLALMTAAVVIALATGAGALPDLFGALFIGLAAHELGRFVLDRLGLHANGSPLESPVLASGLGFGLLGLVGLVLGLLGWLRGPAVVLLLAPLAAMALWRVGPAVTRRARTGGWDAVLQTNWTPSWLTSTLLSITAALLAVATILAVAPEVRSDAVRVHLPIVRAFAEQGRVSALAHLGTSSWPANGHTLYVMGYVLEGQVAAKLLHTAVLWVAVAAAGVLGARYAGSTAGIIAAALVASIPVVMWIAGAGYLDGLSVLYALLATLCLLIWQEVGRSPWLLLFGSMIGFGVASKRTFALTGAALLLAFLLLGRDKWKVQARIFEAGWVAIGGLAVVVPWLARSIWWTGEFPGISQFMGVVLHGTGEGQGAERNLSEFGIGRGPIEFLVMPIALTFRSQLFGENLPGFIGVALFLLLPAIVFLPRTRATATLSVMLLVAYGLWFLTFQYIRFLLPALPLLATMLAAGFAGFLARAENLLGTAKRPAIFAAVGSFIVALCASLVFFVSGIVGYPGGLPVALVLGQQSQDAYLDETLRDYALLKRLDQLVPPGTPVAALTPSTSQLYTHAVVLPGLPGLLTASSEAEVFAVLDRTGVEFVIVDRPSLSPAWESSLLLQPDFLEQHATTVFAANDVYLYRLHQGTGEDEVETTDALNPGG